MAAARDALRLLARAAASWWGGNDLRLAAALAFYAVFSLAPLLLLSLTVAGAVLGEERARAEIFRHLAGIVGPRASRALAESLASVGAGDGEGADAGAGAARALGTVLAIVGATGVFVQMQEALNTLWRVRPRTGGGGRSRLRSLVKARLLSFSVVIGVGLLLLLSYGVSALVRRLAPLIAARLAVPAAAVAAVDLVLAFLVLAGALLLVYRVLPDLELGFRDVLPGALAGALLLSAGRYGFALYLAHTDLASAYGAAGSLVVVLLWTWFSCSVLLYGAEVAQLASEGRPRALYAHAEEDVDGERARADLRGRV